MTKLRRRALVWVLSGSAFLMGIMLTGCARNCAPSCVHVPAAPASRTPIFQQADVSPQASAVNRFGEFDNMPCDLTMRPTSEAGFQQHSFVEEGYDGDVSVSPDGKWLIFSSTRHNTKGDIYLQRVDGTSVIQLTNDDADDSFPTFSPDGQWIAFCSTRAGSWDIYLMDRDGRGVVQITEGSSHDLHPSFAPDGKRLVYSSMSSRSGQWELWTVQLGSNQKRMIGHGLFPSWSPDRSQDRIAFQRARARGSRWFSLWTVDLVDGEARQLTEVAASTNAAVVSPSWSPDGNRLAFATVVEPAQLKEGKPLGQQDIWVIDASGTNRQRLTDGRGSNAAPHWAPDGRVYFISDRGGNESIWSAAVGQSPTGTMNASVDTSDAEK